MIVSRAMISGPHFLNKKTLAPILQTLMKDDTLLKAKNNLGQTPVFLAFKNGLSWLFLQNNQVDILNHKNNQGQNIFHYVVQEQLLTSAICNFDDTDISGPGSTGSTGEIKLGKTSVQRKKSFKQGLLYEELNKLFTDKNNRLTIKGLLLEKDNSGKTPFHYALSQKQYYVYNLLLNWYKQVGGEQKELQKLNLPSYYQNATEDSAKIDAAVLKMGEVESTFDELRTNPAQAGG